MKEGIEQLSHVLVSFRTGPRHRFEGPQRPERPPSPKFWDGFLCLRRLPGLRGCQEAGVRLCQEQEEESWVNHTYKKMQGSAKSFEIDHK